MTGIMKWDPFVGGIKQCKCIVVLKGFHLMVHVWVGNIMYDASVEAELSKQYDMINFFRQLAFDR